MNLRHQRAYVILVLVFSVLGLPFTGCSVKKQLSKNDLKIAAGDLRSFASVAAELARQHGNGKLTEKFYLNQSELLLEKAESAADELDSDAGAFEAERLHGSDIVHRLQEGLRTAKEGKPVGDGDLAAMSDEAKAIEEGLKEK